MNAIQRRQRAKEFRDSPDYEDFRKQKKFERRRLARRYENKKDSAFAFKPIWKNNNPATIWFFILIGLPILLLLVML